MTSLCGECIKMSWEKRKCPICAIDNHSVWPVVASSRKAENFTWEQVKDLFVGLRDEQAFFSYYRCLNCELLYCPWYFSETQLEILYSEMPDNLMGEDKSIVSKTQSGYVSWLSKRTTGKNYIEIGPDIGLVASAVDHIFQINNAYLVEPNKAIHEKLALSMPHANKIQVVEYLNQVHDNEIDLIVGVHVYDHLLDPLKDLKELRSKSSVDSRLIIVVHNENSFLRYLMRKSWPPFCLQHPQLFNPKTLDKLLSAGGWKLNEISQSTNWYSLRNFAEISLKVFGFSTRVSKFLPKMEIPIRLGNIISISHVNRDVGTSES